jgi:hypothetical protein
MGETSEIILGILLLGAVILLTRQFHAWKIKRAYLSIIEDLKGRGAHTPETAIHLPYARLSPIKLGLKDHRPTAIKGLVSENVVGITEDGRYYILDGRAKD